MGWDPGHRVSPFWLPPGNTPWCGGCLRAIWSLQGPQFSPWVALQPPAPQGLRTPHPAVPTLTGAGALLPSTRRQADHRHQLFPPGTGPPASWPSRIPRARRRRLVLPSRTHKLFWVGGRGRDWALALPHPSAPLTHPEADTHYPAVSLYYYLFIFVCAGSSLLFAGFL